MTIQACRAALKAVSGDVILNFPDALPGFEDQHRFTVLESPALAPLVRLQSLDNPQLSLWAASAAAIDPEYILNVTPEHLITLGLDARR